MSLTQVTEARRDDPKARIKIGQDSFTRTVTRMESRLYDLNEGTLLLSTDVETRAGPDADEIGDALAKELIDTYKEKAIQFPK